MHSKNSCGCCSWIQSALQTEKVQIAEWLLSNRCATDEISNSNCVGPGLSLVHIAMQYSSCTKFLKSLLRTCPSYTWDLAAITPIHIAVAAGNLRGLKAFLATISKNWTGDRLKSILERPVKLGDIHMTRFSFRNPAVNRLKNAAPYRATALNLAAYKNEISMVNILLEHGVNVNLLDSRLVSPLYCACWSGSVETMRILLTAGANPNLHDGRGTSCLQVAAMCPSRSNEAVVLLLENDADAYVCDMLGDNALCWAVNPIAATDLLGAGNSVTHKSSSINMSNRLMHRNRSMMAWMMNSGFAVAPWIFGDISLLGSKRPRIASQAAMLLLKKIWKLSSHPTRIEKSEHSYYSIISQAAVIGAESLLGQMLDCRSDAHSFEDPFGDPLRLSCQYGRLESVKILILRGSKSRSIEISTIIRAWHYSKHHPGIRNWILLGRFIEQNKITFTPFAGEEETLSFSPWSGFQKVIVPLTSWYGKNNRSMLEFAEFLAMADRQRMVEFSLRYNSIQSQL
jgi:Ankyrin repeats (3 copies)